MKRFFNFAVFFSALSVTVALPSVTSIAEKTFVLEYRIDEGAEFNVILTGKHHNERTVLGNDIVSNSEDLIEYAFKVKSVDEDGMRLEFEYRNRTHQTDDPQFPAGPDFSGLIGKKAEFTLSKTGETSGFSGFEDFPAILIPDEGKSLVAAQYTNEFRHLFPRLPEKPVAIGESWSDVDEFDEAAGDGTVPLTISYTYTLLEETRKDGHDCLKIRGDYVVDLQGPLSTGGLELGLTLNGTGTETVFFALEKGMFLSQESRSQVEGTADNEDLGISFDMSHEYEYNTTAVLK